MYFATLIIIYIYIISSSIIDSNSIIRIIAIKIVSIIIKMPCYLCLPRKFANTIIFIIEHTDSDRFAGIVENTHVVINRMHNKHVIT
jgi:hypothetical protein